MDDVEAKMVELAALKPDKISEIQYRDARLAELRAELAMLKQGVSDTPSAQSPATPAPVVVASDGPAPLTTPPSWSLITSLIRAPGYRWPLYQFLKVAHAAGKPCPKPRDVVDAWTLKPQPDVQAMPDGVKYNDGLGNSREADLKAIQQAIKNLLN